MRYGLLGERLSHSFSPELHRQLWGGSYGLFSMGEAEARSFLQRGEYDGLNVTIPYKRLALSLCDVVDETARRIGAVNTLLRRDGSLWGWNTDYAGMMSALKRRGISLAGKRVLILGSGGTSRTARAVAEDLGAGEITVISRRGQENYENVYSRHGNAEILINTTPVGMYPHCGETLVDLERFPLCEGLMDVVYNPLRTRLTQQGERLGIPAASGLFMLVEQARVSGQLFAGREIGPEAAEACYHDLLRSSRNLILVGMPGSGKTTVGKLLAQRLHMPFADSDEEITLRTGRRPEEWILQEGEACFRELEAETIRDLGAKHGQVIALGGGGVLREDNRSNLRQNGWICYLERPLALLATEGRPLSEQGAALECLYGQREKIYRQLCDYRCENRDKPEAAVSEIEGAWMQCTSW